MAYIKELYGKPWGEKEYLIVLNYYFQFKNKAFTEKDISELSAVLGRTPAAIKMRLGNFANLDTESGIEKRGLDHWNNICQKVFSEWNLKKESLQEVAEVLKRDINSEFIPTLFEPDPVPISKAFGKYELLDFIGKGGFGSVFSCINIDTGNKYALKIINSDLVLNDEIYGRFKTEIKSLKRINDDNIIQIYEDNLSEEPKYPAFVMELAQKNLSIYLNEQINKRKNKRPVLYQNEAVTIYRSILQAIKKLHLDNTKIIHRDINPNNILLTYDNRWILADFSLAKFASPISTTNFQTNTSMPGWGTPFYMSPEQGAHFKDTDERADIYSLGVLLWELFTKESYPPDKDNHGLEEPLAKIFRKAYSRKRDDRFNNIEQLEEEFEKIFSNF